METSAVITAAADTGDSLNNIERESSDSHYKLGNWFWVLEDDGTEWLGCAMQIGSNFIEIHEPYSSSGYESFRVHLSNVHKVLRYEPNHLHEIKLKCEHFKSEASKYLDEVKAISARLGVSLQPSLMHAAKSTGSDLMILTGAYDVASHKLDLIKAKEEELPALFEKLKETNTEVAKWLSAESMSLRAVMEEMKNSLGVIDDRIFNVSLYAGLIEDAVICSSGEPAAFHEKLHVMQRRLYMDEESLLSWESDGLDFKNIKAYDKWIAKPKNRDRILPFPRCIVAMRVRRHKKDRESPTSNLSAIVKMNAEISDKYTYLYIRNGERVYRLICDIEFDEFIFPDANPSNKPLMVQVSCRKLRETMSRDEFDFLVEEQNQNKIKHKQWMKENPKVEWEKNNPDDYYEWASPYYHKLNRHFDPDDWRPFDSSNVYYDECLEEMNKKIKHYNHVALIIQGLFDRSDILHPHPPVKTWEPESFSQSVELVYDSSRVLHYGEAPDFEAYRQHCNSFFKAGSISVGQVVYWEEKEAEKECRRLDASWRHANDHRPKRFRPYGNPGPGYVAKVEKWNAKQQSAEFVWTRERLREARYGGSSDITARISVPAIRLFNISAYKKGDYLQFFRDPRTREKYLQWAPLLMAAEQYVTQQAKPSV